MSGDERLNDAETDALWEAIEGAFLDTTTFSRASEDAFVAAVERIVAERVAAAEAEALRDFADSLGVNIGDEDSDWWQGYRQGQREALFKAQDRAEHAGGNA